MGEREEDDRSGRETGVGERNRDWRKRERDGRRRERDRE